MNNIAATSAIVAGLSASRAAFFALGTTTIIPKISALPAGIKNHSGTVFASIYFLSRTSFAFAGLICSVVRAFTATDKDSALDTESSGLNNSSAFVFEIKSK